MNIHEEVSILSECIVISVKRRTEWYEMGNVILSYVGSLIIVRTKPKNLLCLLIGSDSLPNAKGIIGG